MFRGLIIENTFTSISAMADILFPYVYYFKHLILRIGWNNDNIVPTLNLPIFYITGDKDEIVPYE
jgi:hypothetical protein